jgi:glutamine synthetase
MKRKKRETFIKSVLRMTPKKIYNYINLKRFNIIIIIMPLKSKQQRTVLEYIWQDAEGHYRSKTKIMPTVCWEDSIETTPLWNFDGSSTGQSDAENSEIYLRPYFKCMDPTRTLSNQKYAQLVFCDLWIADTDENGNYQYEEGLCQSMGGQKQTIKEEVSTWIHVSDIDAREKELNAVWAKVGGRKLKLKPHRDNKREPARQLFETNRLTGSDPWFGFEQEFFFYDLETMDILGWRGASVPEKQGKYYCGVGRSSAVSKARSIAEKVMKETLSIEGHLDCCGWNMEVAPGQCEFQIRGSGLKAADNLTYFRYILQKVAEIEGYGVTFHPKPKDGDWNGSGLHTNYSTTLMRYTNGYKYMEEAINRLNENHLEHMAVYGKDNKMRMTGKQETSSWDKFTWGVSDRTASIRIPRQCYVEQCGYIEDRRPGSNANPYDVCVALANTTVMDSDSYKSYDASPDIPLSFGGMVESGIENRKVRMTGFGESHEIDVLDVISEEGVKK